MELSIKEATWKISNNWCRKTAVLEGDSVDIKVNKLFTDEQLELDLHNGWAKAKYETIITNEQLITPPRGAPTKSIR